MKASIGTSTYDFQFLGTPLKSIRSSWGAENDMVVVLRVWQEHRQLRDRKLSYLVYDENNEGWTDKRGSQERVRHLQSIQEGKQFMVIVCRNEGTDDSPTILFSKDRPHFKGGDLAKESDGTTWATVTHRFKDRHEAREWVNSGSAE